MLLNKLISEAHVHQNGVEDFFVREVRLQSLLHILQVSDHAGILVDASECLSLFKLVNDHHLVRFLLELHVLIVILVAQHLSERVVRGGNHQLTLVVGVREHTLGHSAAVLVLVKEEFVCVGGRGLRNHQKVEVVEDCLLAGAPVIVVEVVINPEETLVKKFRYQGLLESA